MLTDPRAATTSSSTDRNWSCSTHQAVITQGAKSTLSIKHKLAGRGLTDYAEYYKEIPKHYKFRQNAMETFRSRNRK